MAEIRRQPIKINMLGAFSMEYDGNVLTDEKSRTKQVWLLLKYLLTNRHREVTTEELVDILWEDGIDNPNNALKNLVYRLRNLLDAVGRGENGEYIINKRGICRWNNQIECIIDIEELEKAYINAENDPTAENYNDVIQLYRGDFLASFSYEKWVVPLAVKYKDMFFDSVNKCCEILKKDGRYEEIDLIASKAAKIDPFVESSHIAKMRALFAMDKKKEAMAYYEYVNDLFYSELGVIPSEELRSIYNEIVRGVKAIEADILNIKEDLREKPEGDGIHGAFYCEYEVFKSVYRREARMLERSGQSIFVALFTVSSASGGSLSQDKNEQMMELLRDVLVGSLRRGDVVSRYSPSQYIAMLPTVTYENSDIIVKRIRKAFSEVYKGSVVTLECKVTPIEPAV